MSVTRRFLYWNAPGLALGVVAFRYPEVFLAALGWHGFIILLAVADAVFGHSPNLVTASRDVGLKLSLGDEASVTIVLRNAASWNTWVHVADQPPVEFRWETAEAWIPLAPGAGATFTYAVTPVERGNFEFGDLWIRVSCRLGLAARRTRVAARREVRVFPNLAGIRRAELLGRRNRLAEAGIHRLRVGGQGTEFEQLRDYSPDDDYRRINWKATAKRSRPVATDYQVERSQTLLLCVDAGYLMGTALGTMSKLDVAVGAAGLLAHVALSSGDRVGLVLFSHRIIAHVAPAQGTVQMSRLMDRLQSVQADPTRVDYLSLVKFLSIHGKRRSMLALFTDLVDTRQGDELVEALRLLRGRHLPLCLTFRDEPTERMARRRPDSMDDVYLQAVAMEAGRDRARVLRDLARQGAHVVDTASKDLAVQSVNAYLALKQRQLL